MQTQVIFVDTAQYDDYVRWYQKTHGFAPLPETQGEQRQNAHLKAFYQYYRTTNVDPTSGQVRAEGEATAGKTPDGLDRAQVMMRFEDGVMSGKFGLAGDLRARARHLAE